MGVFIGVIVAVLLLLLLPHVEHWIRWRWREKHKYDPNTDEHGRGKKIGED